MADNKVTINLGLTGQQQVTSGLTQINNHITQINGSFNQTSGSSDGLFKKLLGFGTAIYAIDRVASAVTSLGKTMLEVAVSTASANQQAQIGFTTLLGSASKANDFISKLQKFAEVTPFEFSGLQTSSQQLLAVGIQAKDIIPIMTSLGNATAAMGTGQDGIQRAIVAIQQMNAAQAIHAQDLNQLRDAGVPVYELLSKALGKTTKQVAELVQGGKLGQDALTKMMAALEDGTGLERFKGMMDAQSKTLAGEWSNLHDVITIGLGKAISPLIPQLSGAVNAMIKESTPLFAWLDRKAKDLGVVAPMWITYMELKAREAWPHIEAFAKTFEHISSSIIRGGKAFGSGFLDAGGIKATKDLLHDIGATLTYVLSGGKNTSSSMRDIGQSLAHTLRGIDDVLSAIGWFITSWDKMVTKMEGGKKSQMSLAQANHAIAGSVHEISSAIEGAIGWFERLAKKVESSPIGGFLHYLNEPAHLPSWLGGSTSSSKTTAKTSTSGFHTVRPSTRTASKAPTVSVSVTPSPAIEIHNYHYLDGKQIMSSTVSQVKHAAARK